jgi:glycogen debranching enzyme
MLAACRVDLDAIRDNVAALAERARRGMHRFWDEERGYLYDVIDHEGHGDASLRPNQLFALSLPNRAFSARQEASALATVREHLLTPYGLRTLAPGVPAYAGHYGGDGFHRDSVYHQGTVWPWLIGAYADATLNVRGRTPEVMAELRAVIGPLLEHLTADGCLGSVSEIFDGDPPHAPQGCVAQAWSVAEVLRVYALVAEAALPSGAAGEGNGPLSLWDMDGVRGGLSMAVRPLTPGPLPEGEGAGASSQRGAP